MRLAFKILASILLLFNSIGAIYGGWHLITHPDGSSLKISLDWLQFSPFSNYFIPGIILLVVNGLFGFFVLGLLILRHRNFPWFVIAQGALLTGWILVQMIMLRSVLGLQVIMGSTGLALILSGWLLLRLRVTGSLKNQTS